MKINVFNQPKTILNVSPDLRWAKSSCLFAAMLKGQYVVSPQEADFFANFQSRRNSPGEEIKVEACN